MLSLFNCFRKKPEVYVRLRPMSPTLSAEPDFRPPLNVDPNVYEIGEPESELTILDVINVSVEKTVERKHEIEAAMNLMDWDKLLNNYPETKAKFDPVLYNSELVFNSVKEYDAVFKLRDEDRPKSVLSCLGL